MTVYKRTTKIVLSNNSNPNLQNLYSALYNCIYVYQLTSVLRNFRFQTLIKRIHIDDVVRNSSFFNLLACTIRFQIRSACLGYQPMCSKYCTLMQKYIYIFGYKLLSEYIGYRLAKKDDIRRSYIPLLLENRC